MNRFIKWSVILGILFSLVGIGAVTAGAMMGGGYYLRWALQEAFGNGWHHGRWRDSASDYDPEVYRYSGTWIGQEDLPMSEDLPLPEAFPDLPVWEKLEQGELQVQKTTDYSQVRELEVDVFGTVLWKESGELAQGQVRIEAYDDGEDYQYRQKGDKLEMKLTSSMPDNSRQRNTVIIYLPVGASLSEIDVETKAGAFWADRMQASEISLKAYSGGIGVGALQAGELDLDAQAGGIWCSAVVTKEVSAECSAGYVGLTLGGEEGDYEYEMECDVGTILFEGEEPQKLQNVHWEKSIENPGAPRVELECRAGKIFVDFSGKQM